MSTLGRPAKGLIKATATLSYLLSILLVTQEQIESQANLIRAVAVDTNTMPLGNLTHMTEQERTTLANWIASR